MWYVVAFLAGSCVGAILMALCAASGRNRDE